MPQLYYPRHVDATLNRALKTAGAVHIQGPRGCGKTLTARQVCESSVSLDQDTPEANLAKLQPASVVSEKTFGVNVPPARPSLRWRCLNYAR